MPCRTAESERFGWSAFAEGNFECNELYVYDIHLSHLDRAGSFLSVVDDSIRGDDVVLMIFFVY